MMCKRRKCNRIRHSVTWAHLNAVNYYGIGQFVSSSAPDMSDDVYRLVTKYNLMVYPCGLKAGDELELLRRIEVQNHDGSATGQLHEPGEIWIVLAGVKSEPDVIWLRQPDGEQHTWDETIFEWFKKKASEQSGGEARS